MPRAVYIIFVQLQFASLHLKPFVHLSWLTRTWLIAALLYCCQNEITWLNYSSAAALQQQVIWSVLFRVNSFYFSLIVSNAELNSFLSFCVTSVPLGEELPCFKVIFGSYHSACVESVFVWQRWKARMSRTSLLSDMKWNHEMYLKAILERSPQRWADSPAR